MALPTISVDNFGPIRKGTVELRPLTIFTGQSDTGKSWLATLIYSLFSTINFRSLGWLIEESQNSLDNELHSNWEFPEDIGKWYLDSQVENEITFSRVEYRVLSNCMDHVLSDIMTDVERCYGMAKFKELKRWNSKKETKIKVRSNDNVTKNSPFYEVCFCDEDFKSSLVIPSNIKITKNSFVNENIGRLMDFRDDGVSEKPLHVKELLINSILKLIYYKKMGARGSVYLPAGRVGLMESFNILVPSIIEKFSQNKYKDDESENSFPGKSSDFIATLARVRPSTLKFRQETVSDRASQIEKKLLDGEIIVKLNLYGLPYFYFKPFRGGNVTPLNRASSTVTQLAPLVIFLRYSVNKRNLIVLEEPELDLHPEKQVRLIYELVALVQEGYKILITTHSEWFTEALSNVIAYDGETGLPKISSDDVGVWNFEFRKNFAGSVINEIEWNTDLGGYQTEFESVSRRLYNEWVDATEDKV